MAEFDPDAFLAQKDEGFNPDAFLADEPSGMSWSDVITSAGRNFPQSAGQAGKDLITPFVEPIETGKALGNLALGAAQKLIPGEQGSEKYADAVGGFFADRYGGLENLKKTIATDPAGFLLDFSSVLSAGGTAVARVPGKVGSVAKATKAVGDYVDPIGVTAKTVGKTMKGVVNPAAQRLLKQGITPTMGQILGGGVKKAEDALESILVLGSAIGGARQRAGDQLNRAAMNRVLNPIGKSAKNLEIGSSGIAKVSDELSDAYNKLLPKVNLIVDDALIDGIADAVAIRKADIEPAKLAVIERIIDQKVLSKLDATKPMTGKQLQGMQGDLQNLSKKYGASTSAADRIIGEALQDVQAAFREALIRDNPKYASELQSINKGYANYVRLRNAGKQVGADNPEQGFSAAQLRAAVKAEDKSLGKGDFARGRALMQDLSQDANRVMGGNLPTSGTTERAILAGLLSGGYYLDPATTLGVLGLSTPYLTGTQKLVADILTKRPELLRKAGEPIAKYGPRIGRPSYQVGRINQIMEQNNGI